MTQGIPRLKELLNCSNNIKTPYVSATLLDPCYDINKFKEILVSTYLTNVEVIAFGHHVQSVQWVIRFQQMFLNKRTFPWDRKNWIHLTFEDDIPLTMFEVRTVLLEVLPGIIILCTHSSDPTNELYLQLGEYEDVWSKNDCDFNIGAIKNIHISGILGVHDAVVENGKVVLPDIVLSIDYYPEFIDVVDLNTMQSNDIVNTYEILGIEAARELLVREMKGVLSYDGAYVNPRHIGIVCDSITHRGVLRPMSRHGLFTDRRSVLSNASFEMCTATFNSAAIQGNKDHLKGIAEQIIVGKEHDFGTGMVGLFLDEEKLIMSDVTENPVSYPTDEGMSVFTEAYTPTSPEFTPTLWSPGVDHPNYSPAPSGAEFSPCPASPTSYYPSTPCYGPDDSPPCPASPMYVPASPCYAPASPCYAPSTPDLSDDNSDSPTYVPASPIEEPTTEESDWMEEDLLEQVYG